jgi:hypothetical protein
MSPYREAREIANKFVLEHKSTFGQVDDKEITAAVEKIARAIKGVQVASQKAQRLSHTAIPSASKRDL